MLGSDRNLHYLIRNTSLIVFVLYSLLVLIWPSITVHAFSLICLKPYLTLPIQNTEKHQVTVANTA